MRLFCIIGYDAPNTDEKRQQLMDEHIAYLRALNLQGRMLAVGPLLNSEIENAPALGSMLVVNFPNQKAAEDWIANEPYNLAGVYKTIHIHPYIDAIPFVK